ncbi:MAG: putative toxin-antitoxin system toxin component, PIN family [Cyanobacteria bacterium J06635_15]
MRVVIDVNVWVSGLLWGGVPGQVLKLAYESQITSCVSAELLLELETTLRRSKFRDRLQQRQQTVDGFVAIATAVSTTVQITDLTLPDLRDPADTKILATAIAAMADNLITGDQDLLVLQEFQGIPIMTPTQLLNFHFPAT